MPRVQELRDVGTHCLQSFHQRVLVFPYRGISPDFTGKLAVLLRDWGIGVYLMQTHNIRLYYIRSLEKSLKMKTLAGSLQLPYF